VQLLCRCSSTHLPVSLRGEAMVGIVAVSHSPDLARAAVSLALQMVNGPAPPIEIAAGTSDDRLGTDAATVADAIVAADDGDGVVVIMDLGSAVLSAELALELLPKPGIRVRLVPAAFVEGIFAAVISAAGGGQLDAVARDAEEALDAKALQLGKPEPPTDGDVIIARPAIVATATIANPEGIHARPAALIVEALASLEAQVTIATDHSAAVSARSPTALMALGARVRYVLRIEADGAGAETAVDRIVSLVRDGFGEMRGEPLDKLSAQEGARRQQPRGVSAGRVVGPQYGCLTQSPSLIRRSGSLRLNGRTPSDGSPESLPTWPSSCGVEVLQPGL
jgi:dihydroxyacetone kinase phosphotransfer subunit